MGHGHGWNCATNLFGTRLDFSRTMSSSLGTNREKAGSTLPHFRRSADDETESFCFSHALTTTHREIRGLKRPDMVINTCILMCVLQGLCGVEARLAHAWLYSKEPKLRHI